MLALLAPAVFAAEPATLRDPPPSGADLERYESGWRWRRPVEIDGILVDEEGLAASGKILHLRWTAYGKPGEKLVAWQERQLPAERCPSAKDRSLALSSGVLFSSYTRSDRGDRQVVVEQRESPYAACADIPSSVTGIVPAERPKETPAVATRRASFTSDNLPYGSVVRDPPPEIAQRLTIETTDVPRLQVRRIVGGCLASYPASGTFRWEAGDGSWRGASASGEDLSPGADALITCVDALLAPMLPRGGFTVHIAP